MSVVIGSYWIRLRLHVRRIGGSKCEEIEHSKPSEAMRPGEPNASPNRGIIRRCIRGRWVEHQECEWRNAELPLAREDVTVPAAVG